MQSILANRSISISGLRKNPGQLIEDAAGETVAILNRNTATAYLVPPKIYAQMLEALDILEDQELTQIATKRLKDKKKAIKVKIDEL